MTRPILTIDTPAGPVRATADHRADDAVVFELGGAMRGSVHAMGTTGPNRWDRFTAVRACLGPVNAYTTTAPDDNLPRLARGHTGHHGSLTPSRDHADRPHVSVQPLSTTADHPPSEKTEAVLTAVLRSCAEHVAQRADLPAILEASRQRDTPGLLRFLTWSASYHQAEAARLEREARTALPARKAAEAAWRTAPRWLSFSPNPVLLLMLANLPDSLTQKIRGLQWWAPYCVSAAAEEHERARRAQEEADLLRAQQRRRPRRRPALAGTA
ncbi:hypothetical protein EJC51_47520 [Streptomyces aquilus]|uniref:Uncharacterized protein n=1 Tax=Streptomyces aquilus TaxID=2548456 RepID=A0A3Q9C9D2_9ACTN|nr:hypothetical protein [Streptomyces aquilus]AZP14704.1 hypothetical protein EJC51_00025 [Streptomyces aquilus]AZP23000.1 hypothetical protein EJC51_47520 [Streptomyces aquilus]